MNLVSDMAEGHPNARLETFCDGVFAIALTLLVLDIKIPAPDAIGTTRELWLALGHLVPSVLAFIVSFVIILITWVNHHAAFRLVNRSSAMFIYANGFLQTSKYIFIAEPPTECVYLPYRQQQPQRMIMLAQSAGDPSTLAGPLREVVRGLDSNLPISGVRTMEALYQMRAVGIFRVLITVIGAMGLMGLGLAIVGLYGLVAYAVGRRTREIGIRMAVGADRAAVVRMVLRQGLVLALVGLGVGMVASIGAGQLLQAAFPTGDDQTDIVALLLVIPVVLAVTFLAAYVPARQASRVDPILALRHE